MPDVPPPYLRFMRPAKPMWADMYELDTKATTTIDLATIMLRVHRVVGLSVEVAYWPDSWLDQWAIEELLRWEGRENEIRHDKYYADFVIQEGQPAQPVEILAIDASR